ncbi:putative inosine-uridine preferring nucleoside hydrolase [Erysiphe neolycopersici]|uniref:Putative inosine-uridine preferring nucleoside hydrolase n=1 Tax=Erysiphe neolycopersici TaxID=212602 RepID=A0A420HV27_9PEZI|nr:putative inosine-uridine preferring nucleoside hydrolase [Erysiphe neolycopersici]
MNNSQFRKLLLDTSTCQKNQSTSIKATSHNRDDAQNLVLGSRAKSFVPMTPRSVSSNNNVNEFVRQLAERKNDISHSSRKSRPSAAPKGTKLPAGYIDRTKLRQEDLKIPLNNSGQRRVGTLENKDNKELDISTLSDLQDNGIGRNEAEERFKVTKGLDWELLGKVKKGEIDTSDVLENYLGADGDSERHDVETELEKLEGIEVKAISREKSKKKGEMAPSTLTGKKRTRNQILADLKAARALVTNPAPLRLGSKFKKVGDTRIKRKLITDEKGREILIITDENGIEKRKVRKISSQDKKKCTKNDLLIPDKDVKPLGMVVPLLPDVTDFKEDMDIFDDVGDDYNPLAGIESANSSDDEGKDIGQNEKSNVMLEETLENVDSEPPIKNNNQASQCSSQQEQRNYFQTPVSNNLPQDANVNSKPLALSDPTILAALKKASKISLSVTKLGSNEDDPENLDEDISALRIKQERYKRMLQRDDRDALDLDMGFGSSRVEDDNDADETPIKLSDWGVNKKK